MNLKINTSQRSSSIPSATSPTESLYTLSSNPPTPTKKSRLKFFRSNTESPTTATSTFASVPYNDVGPTEPLDHRSRSNSMPNFMVFRSTSYKQKRKQSIPAQFVPTHHSSSSSFLSMFSYDIADQVPVVVADQYSVSSASSVAGTQAIAPENYQDCIIPPPPISSRKSTSIHSITEEKTEFPHLEEGIHPDLGELDKLAHSILSNVYTTSNVNWVV